MYERTFSPEALIGRLTAHEEKNAPAKLWIRGDRSLLKRGPRVSIVGSRNASRDGLRRAATLARQLVDRKAIVVSGLARGVDTVAHREAIAAGGSTVAVIGTGLDIAYPRENGRLQEEIAADHLLVTQFRHGTPPRGANFPQRNRTMAMLSDATVIVAASEKSGTKHQAFEALRMGRLVLIAEPVAEDPDLSWPKEAIKYGAQVLSGENFKPIVKRIAHLTVDIQLPV
ncbi:DNA-processing protein DprA [Candidatus Palauibacter sp.]|uniref:DNA-processing protein DprA n=1 Tax=Candidatus Palauibacter sp. TaxID=3101350 RepID=UPI003CC67238